MFGADDVSSAAVLLAFLGAAFGSFVAVGLQAWISRRGSKSHYRALLRALQSEIAETIAESEERSRRHLGDLRFDAPYSDFAWTALAGSVEVRRVGDKYRTLSAFYSEVAAANSRLKLASVLAQTSAVSPYDEVRIEYRDLAQAFSAETQGRVVDFAHLAHLAVNQLLGES